jgi:DNA-binding winged helix-turn-helix (wHTH) protein/tetratricopeptide (TPR) repeat protein
VQDVPPPSPQVVRFGVFAVDLQAGELYRNGVRVKLQEKPFQVLAVLLERPGEVITREQLRQRLWPDVNVDFEHSLSTAIKKLRDALDDSADNPRFVETRPGRGYRFIHPLKGAHRGSGPLDVLPRWALATLTAVGAVTLLGSGLLLWTAWTRPPLTNKDDLLLTDFVNRTGEEIFDGTLQTGVAVKLEESPFLNIVSRRRVKETLKTMKRPPDEVITAEVGTEICQRQNVKAMMTGEIVPLGESYVITLEAINCVTGDSLIREQVQAEGKEAVLAALDVATVTIRRGLGESLTSIEQYDTPLGRATTPSLEALKVYSLGNKEWWTTGQVQAIPLLKRAVEIDPSFATAYLALGLAHRNIGEGDLGKHYLTKAFEHRENANEHVKLRITAFYYGFVKGEFQEYTETLELITKVYPRDWASKISLSHQYSRAGQHGKALDMALEHARLIHPKLNCYDVGGKYINLNRFEEAKKLCEEALAQSDRITNRLRLYQLGYLMDDPEAMERQIEWAKAKPREYDMVKLQSRLAALRGKIAESWKLRQDVARLAERQGLTQIAATAFDGHEVVELMVGIRDLDEFLKEHQNLSANPIVMAQIAIFQGNPEVALQLLEEDKEVEELIGLTPDRLRAAYVRGQAYLGLDRPEKAVTEFQNVLDNPGLCTFCLIRPLSRLELARAYARMGYTKKSKDAYEEFLRHWKDADPDIPVLQQAKAEYAGLQKGAAGGA